MHVASAYILLQLYASRVWRLSHLGTSSLLTRAHDGTRPDASCQSTRLLQWCPWATPIGRNLYSLIYIKYLQSKCNRLPECSEPASVPRTLLLRA